MSDVSTAKRKCSFPGCGSTLAQANAGKYCFTHEKQGQELEEQEIPSAAPGGESDFLTVPQVARLLPYSERTIRQMLHDGRLKGERLGPSGKWLIPKAQVEALRGGAEPVTPSAPQPKPGQEPIAGEHNWIEDHFAKHGVYPPLPKPLDQLVLNYAAGQPVSKDMVVLTASMQLWRTIEDIPGLMKKWREFLEWLGQDPDVYEYEVRRGGPPGGNPNPITYR